MREVRIGVETLQAKVQENRDAHREIFEKAIAGYTQAAVRFFERELGKARDGQHFDTVFREPVPVDHTEDYDAVLAMLAMTEDDIVTLTYAEFRQYVMDEWGWKQEFTKTSSTYLGQ